MDNQNQPVKSKSKLNKFLLVYFISTIVIIAIVSVGFAANISNVKNYYQGFRDHGPFGFIMEKIVKELDLSDNQKKEMEKIRDEIKAKMDEKKKTREDHMSEFGNLFKQDKLDKEQIMSLANKHEADREEMKSFFIDELIKVHDILTPEQRTKAVEKMKEFKGKHKDGWNKRGPGPENH